MQLPTFERLRPNSLSEALRLLNEAGRESSPLAGGSDLLVNMKLGLVTPGRLVSLDTVPGMRVLEDTEAGGLRIGAGCRLSSLLAESRIVDAYPALAAAMRAVGSQHVRNQATLGGNLCLPTRCWFTNQSEDWRASRQPCFKTDGELCHVIKSSARCHALNSGDTAPALIALGAVVRIAGPEGRRELPLADFYLDDGVDYMALAPGELLTEVELPAPTGVSAFIKVAQRNGLDYAAASIAASFHEGEAKVVVGSVVSSPRVLRAVSDIVSSRGLDDDAIAAAAQAARADLGEVSNLFSPPGYKRRLVRSLVEQVLNQLMRDAA
jgi:4-hydroxybenzoyl-CoA reductase subunit beta